jgi:hypothetical protein
MFNELTESATTVNPGVSCRPQLHMRPSNPQVRHPLRTLSTIYLATSTVSFWSAPRKGGAFTAGVSPARQPLQPERPEQSWR